MIGPKKYDPLPDGWHDYILEGEKYDAENVPLKLQRYVEGEEQPLAVGRHPERGLFLIEFADGIGELFIGWWIAPKEVSS